MNYPHWMPVWPLYHPITFSLAATVAAFQLNAIARATGRSDFSRRLLMALAVALLALMVVPFGLGSTTGCSSDTGGSFDWGPLWWLGPAAVLPVGVVLAGLFIAAGAWGQRPWNLAALVTGVMVGAFLVEMFVSAFSVLALCDPGSATLLVAQLALAGVPPVVGGLLVRIQMHS